MKKAFVLLLLGISYLLGQVNPDYHYVRGYYKKDGTYVRGHYRTNPNETKLDNYSTYPNINPWTGKRGTKKVYDENNYGINSDWENPSIFYEERRRKNSYDYDLYNIDLDF